MNAYLYKTVSVELLPIIFFLIALFYSSVGFGGGSSYLAILSISLANFHEIRSTALLLNLTVVSIGTIMYMRHRVFDWKVFWPFLLPSVPLAYLGSQFRFSERIFFIILGGLLLLSGGAMIVKFLKAQYAFKPVGLLKRVFLGGSIGFFAGVSGIGGGIYLSPLLNMMGWSDARKIASLASVFIMVNSLAGLLGLFLGNTLALGNPITLKLVLGVAVGGLIGSYLSNKKINTRILGLATAFLVIYVGLRLLLLHAYGVKI